MSKLEEPTNLTPWERDKIKLSFAKWLAKRARKYHVDAAQVVAVVIESAAPAASPAYKTEPQAKHVAEASTEPMDAGGVRDRCESTPPMHSPDGASEEVGGFPVAATPPSRGATGGQDQIETMIIEEAPASEGAALGDKSAGPSGSAAPSIASRLRVLHAEHPEYTMRQVAETLTLTIEQVRNNSSLHRIRWTPSGVGGRPRKGVRPPDERKPIPTPERPPEAIRPPVAATPSGTGSAVVTTPMRRPPRGQQFWLRNESVDPVEYLHWSCEIMTTNRREAWFGTQDHLVACRKKFPLARELTERPVEKERAVA